MEKTNLMRESCLIIGIVMLLLSCKQETKTAERNILERIAHAHGVDAWDDVSEIQFTFNVDRDTSHFERHWVWRPKLQQVISIRESDTVSYNRSEKMDDATTKIDQGFINDTFWLLAPFNLVWDKGFDYTHYDGVEAPIGKKSMQKLTIVYPEWGGYTPGDAYDFYFDDDLCIKEWVYRKGNAAEASLTTIWEEYTKEEGLTISQKHVRDEAGWTLYFTNLSVKSD